MVKFVKVCVEFGFHSQLLELGLFVKGLRRVYEKAMCLEFMDLGFKIFRY